MTTTNTAAAARAVLIAGKTSDDVLLLARKALASGEHTLLADLHEAVRESAPARKRRVARWRAIEAAISDMRTSGASTLRTKAERRDAKAMRAANKAPKPAATAKPAARRSPLSAAYAHLKPGQARGILARTKNPTKRAALARIAKG